VATVKSYRDLVAWCTAVDVVELVYRLTQSFPRREVYGLSDQMRRAAVSIPSNLAEGHARDSTKEYLHFVSIAMGSMAEWATQLVIAGRLGYATGGDDDVLSNRLAECGRLVRGLHKALKRRV
jgi:four helix bundle protein